jgi:uncharacterized protein (UPF0333 family)
MNMRTIIRHKKGQSAMEYLMTYGWAILIVIIVAAVLFSLGVFNPATYTTTSATGFSGFNVPSGGFQLSAAGVLTMQLTNGVGANINISRMDVTVGTSTNDTSYPVSGERDLSPGQTTTFVIGNLGTRTSGGSYSASVTVTYNNEDTGLVGFVSTGTLTGAVS